MELRRHVSIGYLPARRDARYTIDNVENEQLVLDDTNLYNLPSKTVAMWSILTRRNKTMPGV